MLTKKGKYGLKAMVHLASAEFGQPVPVLEIAEQQRIPKKFLDGILSELRNAGFVHSKMGKGGGYLLARPAREIMVGDIVRTIDGPLAPVPCASKTRYRRCDDCLDEDVCAVRKVACRMRSARCRRSWTIARWSGCRTTPESNLYSRVSQPAPMCASLDDGAVG